MIGPRPSPAQVSAHGAVALPRLALAALLGAFLVPGLVGHDLWPQDGAGFGRMWTMAHGTAADWLLPNVAGSPEMQGGPLPAWAGAMFLRVGGPLVGELNAAALSTASWYLAGLALLWHAARRLARRDEAQPVAAAFGGDASRLDYARLIGDNAVLLAVATIGVMLRMHQSQGDAPAFALVCLALFCLSSIEWSSLAAALGAGTASGALALTQGPAPALGLLAGCALALAASRRGVRGLGLAALAVAAALLVFLAWPALVLLQVPAGGGAWLQSWLAAAPLSPARVSDAGHFLRTGAWFAWPLWPLAAWTVYAWRESLSSAHLLRPLLMLLGLLAGALFAAPLDDHLLVCLLPGMLVLAALGTATLRRAFENLIDWMAITMFSFVAFFFWAYWAAMQLGVPRAMAASVARIAPGFVPGLHAPLLAVALVASAAWAWVVWWRIARRPRVLWRGPLLSASGVATIWLVANALFLPTVDHLFSYRALANGIARAAAARPGGTAGCVRAQDIPAGELGVLAYHGAKAGFTLRGTGSCPLTLEREARRKATPDTGDPGRGVLWSGARVARPDERWILRVREAGPAAPSAGPP